MRVASRDDRQAERARLREQHDFRPKIFAVHLERVQSPQIVDAEFPELLLRTEHVRADSRDVEVFADIEELAQGRLVAVRQPLGKRTIEPAQLGDLTEDDDVRTLADVDLGSRNQREAPGPEDAALDRIRALELLVDGPEIRPVEMLGEGETVEPDPSGHAHHALYRPRVELEVLGHLRVRVGIDPLQTVRLLSENHPQLSTAIHRAKQPPTQREPVVRVGTAAAYPIYCCSGITGPQIVCCWGQTGGTPVDSVDK